VLGQGRCNLFIAHGLGPLLEDHVTIRVEQAAVMRAGVVAADIVKEARV
jgi:hypothetical protein